MPTEIRPRTDSSFPTETGEATKTRQLKQTRVELTQSEERFRLLVESVIDYAIFLLDPEGYIQSWNGGAQRLKGYSAEEAIGRHFSIFYTPEDIKRCYPQYELEVARSEGRFEDEGWRIRKDGSRFWANVVITRLKDSSGKIVGFAKVTRNLTERRKLEEELRRSNEELDQRVRERTAQLEHAIRARDEFMSIISHELKTPITSLKLQTQTTLRQLERNNSEAFKERAMKFVTGAGRQLDRLAKLIEDMLDVSRISMNRLVMDMEPIDLNEVIHEVVDRFEGQIEGSRSSVTWIDEGPVKVRGDRLRLEQVVSNLLMNAMKYGAGKPIRVSVRQDGGNALISVQDQGIGIAPEDQSRIFERFERAISPHSVSGMGLGLFISREIVKSHRGEILVQSELGKGSTFTVRIPVLGEGA